MGPPRLTGIGVKSTDPAISEVSGQSRRVHNGDVWHVVLREAVRRPRTCGVKVRLKVLNEVADVRHATNVVGLRDIPGESNATGGVAEEVRIGSNLYPVLGNLGPLGQAGKVGIALGEAHHRVDK